MSPPQLPDHTPIKEARNLGPQSALWLASIGIETLGDLRAYGSVAAYQSAIIASTKPHLMFLYALEAALLNINLNDLSLETKRTLQLQLQ